MKRYLLALALILAPAPVMFTACTTTQQTTAHRTIGAVGFSVDSAMSAYADLVVQGRVPAEDQARVRSLHADFQLTFGLAVELASGNMGRLSSDQLANKAAEIIALIYTLKDKYK